MEDNGILLEETLKNTLEAIAGLDGRACPVADIQHNEGPLAVFEQKEESEENTIDAPTGLMTAVFHIHVLHRTYDRMRLLSEQVKNAIQAMRQSIHGLLIIEEVTVTLASRDLYELRVQQFRRTYQVTFQYQIKEDN